VTSTLLRVHEAISKRKDLDNLNRLMLYDHIRYFKNFIEAEGCSILIEPV